MGATDIAKEAIRIASTAGLSKDVIDLLQIEVNLLTDKIDSLTNENCVLLQKKRDLIANLSLMESKNRDMEKELEELKGQEKNSSPVPDGFDDTTYKVLGLFFLHTNRDLSAQDVAQYLSLQENMAEYHCDLLRRENFIIYTRAGFRGYDGDSPPACRITPEGRACAVKKKL